MNETDREKRLIEYMKRIIDHLPIKYHVIELHSIDIRNPSKNSEKFSFEKDLIHELVAKCKDESFLHILLRDPYEPFHDDCIISLKKVENLHDFHVRISYYIENNKIVIVDDSD